MDEKLETEMNAVNLFFEKMNKNGESNVSCPFCKTPLYMIEHGTSYEVRCETDGCLSSSFRGI